MARSKRFQQGSLDAVLKEITEAAKTLSAQRVSIWLCNQDGSALDCIDLYDVRQQAHTSGHILSQVSYPAYFQTLEEERCIAVNDAMSQ